MAALEIFRRRRQANPPTAHAWDPIDSDRDRVVVVGAVGIPDPIRHSETPARPAQIQIAHTGLRADWSEDQSARGPHVEIDHRDGRPKGRQAEWVERVNIASPEPANFGLSFELPTEGASEDETLAAVMGL